MLTLCLDIHDITLFFSLTAVPSLIGTQYSYLVTDSYFRVYYDIGPPVFLMADVA